ncbi:MAG: DUF4118 domain-containing protein [Proteobacteria bacterium]|nr:DUF4118 domain-containing protein [Pseudomonadota bacterium]
METTTQNTPVAPLQRVIAWLDHHPRSIILLNTARRYAREHNMAWCVAYVETPSALLNLDEGGPQTMLRLCTMAEQMGGEVLHLQADNMEKGLHALLQAEKDRTSLFVVGNDASSRASLWGLRTPQWEKVVRVASSYVRVEVVPLTGTTLSSFRLRRLRLRNTRPLHMLYALMAVGLAFLAAQSLQWWLPPALFRINSHNISLLFMVACAFAAGRYGLLPGLVAAISGSLTYSYFFVPPLFTWHSDDVTKVLNMTIFLIAGVVIALFTSRARSYADHVASRERSTQALFTLYRLSSTAFSRQQAVEMLQKKLSQMLEAEVAFFLPPALDPDSIVAVVPESLVLDDIDNRALQACWKDLKTTGVASPLHTHASWRFEPMIAPGGEIGVLAVKPKQEKPLDMWLGGLLTNIADQTAVLIEHMEMGRSMEATRLREEREKLRSMLLSSISHDLKTPLAGIIGALSVHRSVGERLTPQRRQELLDSALEEAQRLDSFITNILDMTRLESGKIDFRPKWHDMQSLIQQVVKRTQHRLKNRTLVAHPCPDDVEVFMDVMMVEQVLQNLLDNACKYTPDGSRIEIRCYTEEGVGFICQIHDTGPGIPDDKLERIFDKYARLQKEDSQVAGTGLGLAIAKAVMDAQQGCLRSACRNGSAWKPSIHGARE